MLNIIQSCFRRASCFYMWNTTEGGPCILRPIVSYAYDAPNADKIARRCVTNLNPDGTCKIDTGHWSGKCKNVRCNDKMVEIGGGIQQQYKEVTKPWIEWITPEIRNVALDFSEGFEKRYNEILARTDRSIWKKAENDDISSWNNQFAFPWEIGMYWNLTTDLSSPGQKPSGCKGLDDDFGTVQPPSNFNPKWPMKRQGNPIFASRAMECGLNTYKPDGRSIHKITDDFATDSDLWQPKFLEAYHIMTTNGYKEQDLEDGPDNAWFGHTSLTRQNIRIGNFAEYIATAQKTGPLSFTDPTVYSYF